MVHFIQICLANFSGGLVEFLLGLALILLIKDKHVTVEEITTFGILRTVLGFGLILLGLAVMAIGIIRWIFF